MKKNAFQLLLLVISINSFSQYDFKKGFIVLNNKDTIPGFIDFTNRNISSNYCFFKNDSNADVVKYTPDQIEAYGIYDAKLFVSKLVTIDNLTQTIFLEYLVDGIVDLYYCKKPNEDFYFIEKNNILYRLSNDFIELNQNGRTMVRESKRYLGILNLVMSDAEEIKPEIYSTELNHNSLIKLSKDYHNMVSNEKCIIYYKKQKKSNDAKWQFDFGVVVDYVRSSMDLDVSLGYVSELFMQDFYNPNTGQHHIEKKWIKHVKITETNAQVKSTINGSSPGIFLNINRNSRFSLQIQLKYQFMKNSLLEFQKFQVPLLITFDFTRYKKVIPYAIFGLSNDFYTKFTTITPLYAEYDYLSDIDIDSINYQIIPRYSHATVYYEDRNILNKTYYPVMFSGIGLKYDLPNHHRIKFDLIGSLNNIETKTAGTVINSKLNFTGITFSLSYEF